MKSCVVPDTRKIIHGLVSTVPSCSHKHDGNVGPDLGDIGDGVETGAALPGDESGPYLTLCREWAIGAAERRLDGQ